MSQRWEQWQAAFIDRIQQPAVAENLKAASLDQDLASWTSYLTTAVVRACESVGWEAAARWNPCERLPQGGKEYLGIDVMAFPAAGADAARWPLPIAVFELENHRQDTRVAYSLWKVLCIRAELRVVFAYRPDWQQSRDLVQAVQDAVVGGLQPDERVGITGETILVIGNRGEGETFPWGYFKRWRLDTNLGRFEKI